MCATAGIALRLGTAVQRIDRHDGGWRLTTSTGDIDGVQVVVATGYEHTPNIPVWPGIEGFTGEVLHSSSYRNPAPFAGKRIVVVGAGSSGLEIAHDLATGGAAKVWLSIRTPPNLMPRKGPAGLPVDVIASPLYHAPVRFADAVTRRARLRELRGSDRVRPADSRRRACSRRRGTAGRPPWSTSK